MGVRSGGAAWLVAASLLVLTGCAADADPAPSPGSADELPAQGPLEEYIWPGSALDGVAGFIEYMKLRESWTAACMSRLGFEYYPAIPAVEDVEEATGPEWGSREFVERYGYGAWIEVVEHAGGFGYPTPSNPEGRAYLSSLSKTAREAYDAALWGEIVSESGGTTRRSGGCAETAGEGIPAEDPFLMGVRDEAVEFLESLRQDPAFAELDAQWSECVAGEGMRFRSPHEARESFTTSVFAYFEDGDHGGIEPLKTPHALERATEEMRVALADLDCRESLDYDRRHTVIAHELQADYVDAHRADLELLAEVFAQ